MDVRALARTQVPPLMQEHPATWRLFRLEEIYRVDAERDRLFADAMLENTAWHYDRNPAYRQFCVDSRVDPADLALPDVLDRLPAIHADVFKHRSLLTLDGPELLKVTSSGTGGHPTAMALDAETVVRMWAMGLAAFREEALIAASPVHYVVFAPQPTEGRQVGNAHFFSSLMELAPVATVTYALAREADGRLRLCAREVIDRLGCAGRSGEAARLIGLPALIAAAALATPAPGIVLPPDSLVLTGGGWKGTDLAAIAKEEFRSLLSDRWGLAGDRIRDLYGMTEHAVHYLECREHRFHAPAYARVRVIDPISHREMPAGEWGVMHLMNPGFTTAPLQSLITADVGRWSGPCSCGRLTPAFEVRGRSTRPGGEGCAATTLGNLRA